MHASTGNIPKDREESTTQGLSLGDDSLGQHHGMEKIGVSGRKPKKRREMKRISKGDSKRNGER